MQLKTSNVTQLGDGSLDMWQMLMHCALRLNISRIAAERMGRKYDRNEIVYDYFRRKLAAKNSEGERMIKTITKRKKSAGYAFDQYFLLFHGMKPTPDAAELGHIVKEGLDKYGYAAAV